MQSKKTILLIALLVGIVGSIVYLESKKPPKVPPGSADIPLSAVTELEAINSSINEPISTIQKEDRTKILAEKSKEYPRAKEITYPSGYINTEPLTIKSLIGKKVVLIDFWTYSCINCQRTTPYLNAWYLKYKDLGLEIVAPHTPEFDFEKDPVNVKKAVEKFGIKYPVVQDNDYGTWNAYANRYWPRKYLIDIDGFIVGDHIGEGGYEETERQIQEALRERARVLGLNITIPSDIVNPSNAIAVDTAKVDSPETYFGFGRNQNLGNGKVGEPGTQKFTLPTSFERNKLYLSGVWNITTEYAENKESTAKIIYKFKAKNVYFVASSLEGVSAKILIDGKVAGKNRGVDVSSDGTVLIKDNRLYHLVEESDYSEHIIEIIIDKGSLQAFTFTFG